MQTGVTQRGRGELGVTIEGAPLKAFEHLQHIERGLKVDKGKAAMNVAALVERHVEEGTILG